MDLHQKWPMDLTEFLTATTTANFTRTRNISGLGGVGGSSGGNIGGLSTSIFHHDYNHNYGENDWFSSGAVLALVTLYGVVVFGGVLGNASLVITLCSQPSGRLRNPLLVALCLADLMVSGVSAPLTIVALVFTYNTWTLPSIGCKTIYYMQSMPVAASTICFLMLSLDRYATVKHPRLAQLRQRRFIPAILASGAWISAGLFCIPILLAYKITTTTWDLNNSTNANGINNATSTTCQPDYGSAELQISFIVLHTLFVFIIPAFGVILNHLGVRRKLCALSLTARAAHGELPLPMPILRRPTHMIIVTGMANAARGVVGESSDDENAVDRNFINDKRQRSCPRTPRSVRKTRKQQSAATAASTANTTKPPKQQKVTAPVLPLPQTSTLRSRRRLANMLVAAALIFAGCWTPHVVCVLCIELGASSVCPRTVSEFSLLLGYAHSAVSPILYWVLNHNTLRQSSCAPCSRLNTAQKFLRNHLRIPAAPPPPSSTNEAALGPFNPRYIKARPQQNMYRPPASSHYLY